MINKEDLQKKIKNSLTLLTPGDSQGANQAIIELLEYTTEHQAELTTDAQVMIDKALEIIKSHFEDAINKMPDGRNRRELKRKFAISKGEHSDVKQLLKILESPPAITHTSEIALEKAFLIGLQNILDLLFDVRQNTLKGKEKFTLLGLLYMCIDELLSAFHLARRKYINQAYSHIRTVFEHIDLVELFTKKPEWIDVWIGDDEEKKRNKFLPGAVRKKLGRGKYDPIYSFFCELGPHSTFKALQSKTAKQIDSSLNERPKLTIWIGGCPFEHNIVFVNAFLIYVVNKVVLQIGYSFKEYIIAEEYTDILHQVYDDMQKYFKDDFFQWAKNNGLDTADFKRFLVENDWKKILGNQ